MAADRRTDEASVLRDFFHEHWQHLARLLWAGIGGDSSDRYAAQASGAAVDMLVAGTDARVRAVHNYKKELRAGTGALLQHIGSIVDGLPGAINLTRHNFIYDPQISTFFSSMEDISILCRESSDVSEYVTAATKVGEESFYALLFMRYREKEFFGNALRGDVLQREVKQTSVFFTDHQLLAPANSELAVRLALKRILFENVIEYLKQKLTSRRREELRMAADHSRSIADKMQSLDNPMEYLRTLVELLKLPQELIRLHENTVRINRMGIKVVNTPGVEGEDVYMQNIELGEEQSHLLILAEIPWGILDIENN